MQKAALNRAEDIPRILEEMTLEEKARLIITPKPCITFGKKESNIPEIILADGATGVNGTHIMLDFLMDMISRPQENARQQKRGKRIVDRRERKIRGWFFRN